MHRVLIAPLPEGRPTTSTQRMLRKRLREQGDLPPLPNCTSCGKQLKIASGNGRAYQLGLCWDCFRVSPEGKAQKRKSALKGDVWAVGYFSAKPDEPLVKHDRLRAAIGYAYVGRNKQNGPVFIVWSDAQVTEHYGLSATNSKGMTPDHPSKVDFPVSDPQWFLDQIPEKKRTWFEE